MRDLASEIYSEFHCTADKCPITCCQEWKIAVEETTEEKWTLPDYQFEGKRLCDYLTDKEDERVIKLMKNGQCPFLNEKKLCKLVINYQDEILSHTCQIFPREILTFSDHKEYALAACCPAVVDLLNRTKKLGILELENDESDSNMNNNIQNRNIQNNDPEYFLLNAMRSVLFSILQETGTDMELGLMAGFFFLLEMYYGGNREEVLKRFQKKNYLEHQLQTIKEMDFSWEDSFTEQNELFLDLVVNYREEGLYQEFLKKTVPLAERISEGEVQVNEEQYREICREVFEPYLTLFYNYLIQEIFAGFLHPERDMRECILSYQWIVLTYTTIKHSIWLLAFSDLNERSEYTDKYAMIREGMVILSRMTGYDDEDIEEYLDNSFDEPVWDWGYFALLTGHQGIFQH